MPFKSEAQRRKFHAMKSRGEISGKVVKEWQSATKGKLPEKVAALFPLIKKKQEVEDPKRIASFQGMVAKSKQHQQGKGVPFTDEENKLMNVQKTGRERALMKQLLGETEKARRGFSQRTKSASSQLFGAFADELQQIKDAGVKEKVLGLFMKGGKKGAKTVSRARPAGLRKTPIKPVRAHTPGYSETQRGTAGVRRLAEHKRRVAARTPSSISVSF